MAQILFFKEIINQLAGYQNWSEEVCPQMVDILLSQIMKELN